MKFPYGGAAAYRAVVSSGAGDPAAPQAAGAIVASNQRDFDLSNKLVVARATKSKSGTVVHAFTSVNAG